MSDLKIVQKDPENEKELEEGYLNLLDIEYLLLYLK
jgi:hypothetical protein